MIKMSTSPRTRPCAGIDARVQQPVEFPPAEFLVDVVFYVWAFPGRLLT